MQRSEARNAFNLKAVRRGVLRTCLRVRLPWLLPGLGTPGSVPRASPFPCLNSVSPPV